MNCFDERMNVEAIVEQGFVFNSSSFASFFIFISCLSINFADTLRGIQIAFLFFFNIGPREAKAKQIKEYLMSCNN